jgi:hypothetical protein
MNEKTEREAFEAWWDGFIDEHEEWRYADSAALRWQAWKARASLGEQQAPAEPHKPLFADMIAQHPGLAEELAAAPEPQGVPDGWRVEKVSDGDIRMYGPRQMFGERKETWLIQSGMDGFYGFLHRYFSAMLAAHPQQSAPAAPVATLTSFDIRSQTGTVDLHGEWMELRVGDKFVAAALAARNGGV